MSKLIIEGQRPLSGEIRVAGSKNAALPLMAATLLTAEPCFLMNVPRIRDVVTLGQIIESLGVRVEGLGTSRFQLTADRLKHGRIASELVSYLRASVLLLGPLLARFGQVILSYPGGCSLGRRDLNAHFLGIEALGGKVRERSDDTFCVTLPGIKTQKRVFLSEASVTATENILMAAALSSAQVTIFNAACEPHVVDLCQFLKTGGVKIDGIGSNLLRVTGTEKFKGVSHSVVADYLEMGSFICLAALAGRGITIKPTDPLQLAPLLSVYSLLNVKTEVATEKAFLPGSQKLVVNGKRIANTGLFSQPWPSFPTDLLPTLVVLATQAEGQVLIHEKMYEGRLFFVDKLLKMGANIILCDPHRVVVKGRTPLKGAKMETPDIRAGMALLLAALCAKGKSEIDRFEVLERGYENLVRRLSDLGAKVRLLR